MSAYDDEDNAPMVGDLPLLYPIRTWEEIQEAWERQNNGETADGTGKEEQ